MLPNRGLLCPCTHLAFVVQLNLPHTPQPVVFFTSTTDFFCTIIMERFKTKDLIDSRTCELHLDVECLENLIFSLILASNEMKFRANLDGKKTDVAIEISIHKEKVESCTGSGKKVYPGIALKVLGVGVFINDDNSVGVHNEDDW